MECGSIDPLSTSSFVLRPPLTSIGDIGLACLCLISSLLLLNILDLWVISLRKEGDQGFLCADG